MVAGGTEARSDGRDASAPAPASTSPRPALSHEAFTALYEAQFGFIVNTLRRLGVRESDLEDVAHELFLAVHRQWGSYDDARPLRAWLFGFAFRAAAAYGRLARHRSEEIREDHVADDAAHPEAQLEARQKREMVLRALDALPMDRRSVFVSHELEGLPIPEVAACLGIPLNTAYSRLRIARGEFNTAIRALIGGSE